MKTLLWGFALVLILGYGYTGVRDFLNGPELTIEQPQNGISMTESKVTISGNTKRIGRVTLDNRDIFISEDGRFEELLLLAKGYNIIEMVGYDKFGRTVKNTLELTHK